MLLLWCHDGTNKSLKLFYTKNDKHLVSALTCKEIRGHHPHPYDKSKMSRIFLVPSGN